MAAAKYWTGGGHKYEYHVAKLRKDAGLTMKEFSERTELPLYLCQELCGDSFGRRGRLLRPAYMEVLKAFFSCEEEDIVTEAPPEPQAERVAHVSLPPRREINVKAYGVSFMERHPLKGFSYCLGIVYAPCEKCIYSTLKAEMFFPEVDSLTVTVVPAHAGAVSAAGRRVYVGRYGKGEG